MSKYEIKLARLFFQVTCRFLSDTLQGVPPPSHSDNQFTVTSTNGTPLTAIRVVFQEIIKDDELNEFALDEEIDFTNDLSR
jgi:hypothetical protein